MTQESFLKVFFKKRVLGVVILSLLLLVFSYMVVRGDETPPPPAPTLISPAHGTISTSGDDYLPVGIPLFEWEAVEGATTYDIQIDNDFNFVDPLIQVYQLPLTFYKPISVRQFPDGKYYWRVRTRINNEIGEWTDATASPWSFTKAWATVSAPTLIYPDNFASLEFLEAPLFSWDPVVGAARYRLEVSPDPAFGTVWRSWYTVFTTFTPYERPDNGTYYWRVSAYDADEKASDYSEVRQFMLDYNQVPILLEPADNAQPEFTPTFRWTAVKGAWRYKFQYSTTEDFTANVVTQETPNATYTPESSIPNDVDYYWRVCAQYTSNGRIVDGPWSEVRSFEKYWHTVDHRLRLLTPPESQLVNYPVLFSWTPVREAAYYRVQICRDFDHCDIQRDVRGSTVLSHQWFTTVGTGHNYVWRVTPYDNNNNPGSESEWGSFRTTLAPTAPQPELISPRYYYDSPGDYVDTDSRQMDIHYTPISPVPTFAWTRVISTAQHEAHHYVLQVSTSTLFINNAWEFETRNLSATPDDAHPFNPVVGTDYYWRVFAYDENDVQMGMRSERWRTRIDTTRQVNPTAGISLTYPMHGQEIMEITPAMRWLPVQGAAGYELEIHHKPDCSDAALYSTTTRYVQHTPPMRLFPDTYFWRVRALDASDTPIGGWSTPYRFTIEFQTRWNFEQWSSDYNPSPDTDLMTVITATKLVTDVVEAANGAYDLTDLYANGDFEDWYIGFHVDNITSTTPVWYGIYVDTNQDDARGADVGPPSVLGLPGNTNITTYDHHRPEFAIFVNQDSNGINTDHVWLHIWDLDEEQWNYPSGEPRDLLDVVDIGGGIYVTTTGYIELRIPKEQLDNPGSLSLSLFSIPNQSASTISDSVPDSGDAAAVLTHFASVADRATLLYPDPSPLDGEMSFHFNPVLMWQSPDADYYRGYEVEVALDEDFLETIHSHKTLWTWTGNPHADIGPTGHTMLVPLADNTKYFWRVKLIHRYGNIDYFGEPSDPMSFVKYGAPPEDLDVSVDYTIPTFSWKSVEGAAKYRVEASQNPDFSGATTWSRDTNHHEYTPHNVNLPLGTWYWRVRVVNHTYVGDPSSVMSFTLTLPTPIPIWPEDEAVVEYGPTFRWNTVLTPTVEPIFHPRRYRLQICSDANCANNVFSIDTETTSYTWYYSFEDTTGYYYWRVAVLDSFNHLGPYSPVRAFHKQGAAVEMIAPLDQAKVEGTPIFFWDVVTGTRQYEIEVSQDQSFTPIYDKAIVHSAAYAPLKVYEPLKYYWWRVRSCDYYNHCGPWTMGRLDPADLTIEKEAPATSEAGVPFTYTLTIANHSLITGTNVVITDAIPTYATYLSGGTRVGNTVQWTLANIVPFSSTQVSFVVQASQTITNSAYGVVTDEGMSARGESAVVTLIGEDAFYRVYLPLAIRQP